MGAWSLGSDGSPLRTGSSANAVPLAGSGLVGVGTLTGVAGLGGVATPAGESALGVEVALEFEAALAGEGALAGELPSLCAPRLSLLPMADMCASQAVPFVLFINVPPSAHIFRFAPMQTRPDRVKLSQKRTWGGRVLAKSRPQGPTLRQLGAPAAAGARGWDCSARKSAHTPHVGPPRRVFHERGGPGHNVISGPAAHRVLSLV